MSFLRKLSVLTALCVLAAPPAARAQETTLNDIKKAIDALRDEAKAARQLQILHNELVDQQIRELRQRLAALEQKVDSLPRNPRTSEFPRESGTIRLENRRGIPATFILNGVSYRLAPFETRELPTQPAGTFTYEVLMEDSHFGPATRVLGANRIFTIWTY